MNVIQIENLWKKYRLGVIGHGTLTHDLQSWWARKTGREDPNMRMGDLGKGSTGRVQGDSFWALMGIDLIVQEGSVLGIIGGNGAGKSTLLKILSRVTAPSIGQVKVRGRIASLLEVGTGFHPELTGRENIFLNGAVLGMSKIEIKSKLDEIIEFSGVEQHIDTPVKRYSSGMYVRLAFSVAAHLEPEILVIDEVLAVGDVEFQKKCLGKMNEVARAGRTVLFVSHNMSAIDSLCRDCILLKGGKVVDSGPSKEIVTRYLSEKTAISDVPINERVDRDGIGGIRFAGIQIFSNDKPVGPFVKTGDKIGFRLFYNKLTETNFDCRFSVNVDKNEKNFIILDSYVSLGKFVAVKRSGFIDFLVENFPLSKGAYIITIFVASRTDVLDCVHDVYELTVEDGDFYGTGRQYPDGWAGQTVLVDYSLKYNQP